MGGWCCLRPQLLLISALCPLQALWLTRPLLPIKRQGNNQARCSPVLSLLLLPALISATPMPPRKLEVPTTTPESMEATPLMEHGGHSRGLPARGQCRLWRPHPSRAGGEELASPLCSCKLCNLGKSLHISEPVSSSVK